MSAEVFNIYFVDSSTSTELPTPLTSVTSEAAAAAATTASTISSIASITPVVAASISSSSSPTSAAPSSSSISTAVAPLAPIATGGQDADSHAQGPPYLSPVAILGEIPSKSVDIPITTVFLVLFIVGAALHMKTFRQNKARGHKFLPSFFIYVFCMARTVSCIMRIAWACHPTNAGLSIAAFIFVSAGVLILFMVNLVLAQRILRAMHPQFGWNKKLSLFFKVCYLITVILLITTIFAIVDSHYSLDRDRSDRDRDLQLVALCYFLFLAILPLLIIYFSKMVPRTAKPEKFGSGRWRTKVRMLTTAAALCTFGAVFRTGTNFLPAHPPSDPAWWHSKACFYLFNFSVEVLVVYLYLIWRIDRRFHVPDGSSRPGDYTAKNNKDNDKEDKKRRSSFSSYARLFDGSSSIYEWGENDAKDLKEPKIHEDEDAVEEDTTDVESKWSFWSENSEKWLAAQQPEIQLPPAVHPSCMRVVDIDQAPYVDIRFHDDFQRRYQVAEREWLAPPPPATLHPFGL